METDTISVGEAYLEHFGIKGMKWGQRKDRSSGSSSGSSATQPKKKIITGKRVAVGLAVAAGTLYVGTILARGGSTKVPHVSTNISMPSRPHVPSPFEMRVQAGSAAHRNALSRIMNQSLTDKTWRDSARMSQMARFSASKTSVADLSDVNQRLMSFTDEALRRGGAR